jgi:hypothetical protein
MLYIISIIILIFLFGGPNIPLTKEEQKIQLEKIQREFEDEEERQYRLDTDPFG